MHQLLFFFFLLMFSTVLHAQNDTIPKEQSADVEYYDVVAIYREVRDGRGNTKWVTSQKKGEILSHDSSTGQLTFRDLNGKMYSLNSEQYEYFIYDKEFKIRRKRNNVVLPRKDSGFEIGVGLSSGATTVLLYLTPDDNFINTSNNSTYIPVSVKIAGSRYLNERSSVGLTSELSFLNSESTHFNIGGRYQFLYNPNKNKAFYFPAELKYAYGQYNHRYGGNDTIYNNSGGWTYPTVVMTKTTLSSLEICAGQGLSFALENKRSLAIELMLFKQFVATKRFENKLGISPQTDFNIYGARLSAIFYF